MKVIKQKKDGNTVSLTLEASDEILRNSMETAYQKLVKSAKVPGFRKGKVPRKTFEKYYGKETIIQEAVLDAVNDTYRKAIEELDLRVIDYPKNLNVEEFKEGTPLRFSCDVDVIPEVKLGKYKGLKVKVEQKEITEEQVVEQIDRIRENYADYQATDRAAADDDILRCDMSVIVDEKTYEPWSRTNVGLKIGMGYFGKEFDEKLIGQKPGETRKFTITFPEDFENADLKGKTANFEVRLEEVREKKLPELDDEFAAKVSNFKTAEELRKNIRESLEKQAADENRQKIRQSITEEIIKGSKMDIPQIMIDREIDYTLRSFDNTLRRSGSSLEQYSQRTGVTKEQIRSEFKEGAEKRVQTELVLDAIAQKENITVTDEDLDAEIKKWNHPTYHSLEDVRNSKKQDVDLNVLEDSVKNEKTYQFLIDNNKVI